VLSKEVDPVILGPTNIVMAAPAKASIPPTPKAAAPSRILPVDEPISWGANAPKITVPSDTIPAPVRTLFIVLPVFNLNATVKIVNSRS